MPHLESFLQTWDWEFGRTMRVFGSYPADRLEYRPHEKSQTARWLMWIIVDEEREFVDGCLQGKIVFGHPEPPDTKEDLMRAYELIHHALVAKVRQAGEDLFHKTIKILVNKEQTSDANVSELLWGMLHDQIHHRGQLSVYLRLVGARVPSIYGPSGDESP